MQRRVKITLVHILVLASAFVAGCTTDELANPQEQAPQGPTTSLEHPEGVKIPNIPVADRSEVDLVEEMILNRTLYVRYLRALITYYTEHGYENKANWARNELRQALRIKAYSYIDDAQAPMAGTVKPTESIAEADRLYEDGVKLMKKAGHGVPIFYNDQTMNEALSKFMELVDKYPHSDKVADACFLIAEIHKEYGQEKDNTIALKWYQAAIDANPSVQRPARFQMAVVYDYRMHEREKALALYQEVLAKERFNKSNLHFSNERIRQLTTEETRKATAEPTPGASDVRPSPAPTPEPAAGHGEEASPPEPKTP